MLLHAEPEEGGIVGRRELQADAAIDHRYRFRVHGEGCEGLQASGEPKTHQAGGRLAKKRVEPLSRCQGDLKVPDTEAKEERFSALVGAALRQVSVKAPSPLSMTENWTGSARQLTRSGELSTL